MAVEIGFVREQRSLWKAIGNGVMCRCPNCGKGKLFRSYLKINDSCSECGEKLSSARADDFPPYIAIFIVGHILVGWMLHAEMSGPVDPMLYVWTMIPAAIVLPLIMLPSIKGAVVGLQWANYMYGFDPTRGDTSKSDV
ncbi:MULTISPECIES: DUF983 domain-containing protein [unclassified Devosia]|jgi:uncharacterized protein (DUF983 family)|uniref:DUF983 domain-containing protein n=1 Tax=unclassified Devosia TaxID=196773 RepID=UPI00086B364F|nr:MULTISPECIES: DUF983 domain-containing protein [unclassified Devosia]MBN9361295.1 DUF983 domain-containing protein [Devosia sp.]ODS94147.1 MAG: hypothetical protein ABS47_06565 [Devosia sp. SCN 66-27]OJX26381.1 MAG: hypothetical protein BGO83_21020 [Devosia sp. 66-14]